MTNALVRERPAPVTSIDEPILADAELWDIVSSGDLKTLSPKQRSDYYLFRCRQEGLNPASQPFTYLVLNGKGVLYGNKTAADQLRKVHGISIVDLKFFDDGEYLTYEITMQDREGRRDIDVGQVFVGTLKGEQRANARMKAITKAKRRATYSICGTGVLDESEIETIPGSKVYEDLQAAGFPERRLDAESAVITSEQIQTLAAGPLNLDDDIRRLREALGWQAQDVIDEARKAKPVINLRTRDGKQAMVDLLQSYVDAVTGDENATRQEAFVDVESHVAGEPGLDQHSA